ncbi:hypothetical protein AK812_SmicGene9271 [Symbiodinium microadriaticum]|uniref:Uncharacterized protein n=1 Tax=Symbiodinium microadriaticum TaxID=2951 RepID=A0A1Q9EIQ4_SYMMI|nr:hypothetical protein AK812_SmicGene9271 [Symbiodinium microadriaticum]
MECHVFPPPKRRRQQEEARAPRAAAISELAMKESTAAVIRSFPSTWQLLPVARLVHEAQALRSVLSRGICIEVVPQEMRASATFLHPLPSSGSIRRHSDPDEVSGIHVAFVCPECYPLRPPRVRQKDLQVHGHVEGWQYNGADIQLLRLEDDRWGFTMGLVSASER